MQFTTPQQRAWQGGTNLHIQKWAVKFAEIVALSLLCSLLNLTASVHKLGESGKEAGTML